MAMRAYRMTSDEVFIEAYGVELSYNENGKPTGKIRATKPVSEEGFVEEMLIRKPRLLKLLLREAGWKQVELWLVAHGPVDDEGNRSEAYNMEFASLDEATARKYVEDERSVPAEVRKGTATYLDSYPLILKADDNRTADELVRDIYMSKGWPYSREVDSMTRVDVDEK